MKEVNEIWAKITKNRYKIIKDYKFDRWIFQIFMIFVIGYLFFVAYKYNFDLDYFYCPEHPGGISGNRIMLYNYKFESSEGKCKNPFYENVNWKNLEYLPPGEYGFKPNIWFKICYWGTSLAAIFVLILNHLVHNRKFQLLKKLKGLKDKVPEKLE